jgi:two-component system, OmpR family, sensor kinase
MRWPRTLRWRLALSIAAVLVLAAGATFVAIYRGTGSELRSQIDRELRSDSGAFLHRGLPAQAATPQAVEAAARAYVSGQPFRATARLVFVRSSRGAVVTNEPELLTPDHEPGETAARQREENQEASALLGAKPGYSTVTLADVGEVRLLVTPLVRDGRRVGTVGVGEPLESAERAQRGVAGTFLVAGTLTLLAALIAAFLVAAATARPLRRMASVAARVDAGDLSPRMDPAGSTEEIRVLAESFDHMLDRLEAAFRRQREFVSDASHELRTPLTVLRGQTELLGRVGNDPEERRRVTETLLRELDQMNRLVEDMLSLAKAESGELVRPRPLDLDDYLQDLERDLPLLGEREYRLEGLHEGTLDADPERLTQVFRNLVRNAIRHTAPGDRITVSAGARNGRIEFCVADTGPGIPPEQLQRIFDRFYRTDEGRDRDSGGSGLGLPIARAIVEAHGGRIWAESPVGGGARIRFELPRYRR